MKRILLLTSLGLAGIVSLAIAREPAVLRHVTDQTINKEIHSGLMPLRIKVTPQMFSRRSIPNQESLDYYVTVQPGPDAEIVPFTVVKLSAPTFRRLADVPPAAPRHYADARLVRETKTVELAWVNPLTGKRSYLPVEDWLKRSAPAS